MVRLGILLVRSRSLRDLGRVSCSGRPDAQAAKFMSYSDTLVCGQLLDDGSGPGPAVSGRLRSAARNSAAVW